MQFLDTVYDLQLCVGDAFLFPIAKPSRSFQNLTKKSALIALLLSKSRKNGQNNENRLTNITFTSKNDLDYKFFHCGNVSKGCNHFLGEKGFCCVVSSPEPLGSQGELIVYASSRRPSSVRPSSTMLKHLLLRNRWADQSQILCGASLGRGNESLYKWSRSHDQDGRHAHIW